MTARTAATVLLSLVLASCAVAPASRERAPRQVQVAIYETVLQSWLGSDHRAALVNARLSPAPSATDAVNAECTRGVDFQPAAGDLSALESLRGVRFTRKGVQVIDGATWKPLDGPLMSHLNDGGPDTLKQDLDRAMAHSLITFSKIHLDRSGRWALLSFSSVCGALCGSGATYLLHRDANAWRVFRRCNGWVS